MQLYMYTLAGAMHHVAVFAREASQRDVGPGALPNAFGGSCCYKNVSGCWKRKLLDAARAR